MWLELFSQADYYQIPPNHKVTETQVLQKKLYFGHQTHVGSKYTDESPEHVDKCL